jgi:hypothetical protein
MRSPSRVWTALYNCENGSCYNIQFGHKKGPLLSHATAKKLANHFLKQFKESRSLESLYQLDQGDRDELGY